MLAVAKRVMVRELLIENTSPGACDVEPPVSAEAARSSTITSEHPSSARCSAIADPTIPAPTITTWAESFIPPAIDSSRVRGRGGGHHVVGPCHAGQLRDEMAGHRVVWLGWLGGRQRRLPRHADLRVAQPLPQPAARVEATAGRWGGWAPDVTLQDDPAA